MSSVLTIEEINRLVSENAALRERGEALEAGLAEEKRLTMALAGESDRLREAAQEALEAFEFTRQYVGYDMLPPLPGWSWYDACERLRAALAAHEPQGGSTDA